MVVGGRDGQQQVGVELLVQADEQVEADGGVGVVVEAGSRARVVRAS
jgi:hypothetical protein